MLIICIALIIALLPIVIMRKIKESNFDKKREEFYTKCRSLTSYMTKNEVISIMGDDYTFSFDLNGEHLCWSIKDPKNEIACVVTFVDGLVVRVEMK